MIDGDCEDQGCSSIAEGCKQPKCIRFDADGKSIGSPIYAVRGWWICSNCDGSYGPATSPLPAAPAQEG